MARPATPSCHRDTREIVGIRQARGLRIQAEARAEVAFQTGTEIL